MNKEDKKPSENAAKKGNRVERNKIAKMVAIRNRFFFLFYKKTILVLITSIFSVVSSIGFLIFFIGKPVPPQFIPIDEDGRIVSPAPLSACKSDGEVQRFYVQAISKLYKYDYINYPDQILTAVPFFTRDGWNEYLTNYKSSGTLEAVKESKYVVSVVNNDVPQITKKWEAGGVCVVELKTKITITYYGASSRVQSGVLFARIRRESVINNEHGLGIEKIVLAEEAVPQ